MALTNNDKNNLAGITSSFGTASAIPGGSIGPSTNPASTIPSSIAYLNFDKSAQWSYPPDLPPVHFGMIETEFAPAAAPLASSYINSIVNNPALAITTLGAATVSALLSPVGTAATIAAALGYSTTAAFIKAITTRPNLNSRRIYRLPLPNPLKEQFEVNFNPNYQPAAVLSPFGDPGSALLGIIPNTFKTVTLSQPDFRRHMFSWTLSPRTYEESQLVQKILFNIKKGMHPKRFNATVQGGIMRFPYIYYPYFSPNVKYLFKFKPCVIQSVDINYQGGQPVPAFYRQEGSPENKPPESIMFSIIFLELEYWLDGSNGSTTDFKGGDLPTNDPFDAMNYYQLASGAAAATSAGTTSVGPAGPGG